MPDSITIGSPAANSTVPANFTASGSTSTPNTPVTVTLDVPGNNPITLTTTSNANGTWSVTYNAAPPGNNCTITAKWTNDPTVSASVGGITIGGTAPPGGGTSPPP